MCSADWLLLAPAGVNSPYEFPRRTRLLDPANALGHNSHCLGRVEDKYSRRNIRSELFGDIPYFENLRRCNYGTSRGRIQGAGCSDSPPFPILAEAFDKQRQGIPQKPSMSLYRHFLARTVCRALGHTAPVWRSFFRPWGGGVGKESGSCARCWLVIAERDVICPPLK